MATTNTYLNFNGNCEKAFTFYKSVFGTEFSYIGRFHEIPESEEYKIPEEDKNKIMHVSLPIGNSVLMGSHCGKEQSKHFVMGNNFSISISAESKEEVNRLFNNLSDDGIVIMPLSNTFWSEYFGMLTDKFGVNWMVSLNEQNKQ